MLTNEQLGARVDRVEDRLASVETQVSSIKESMATKSDIDRVLAAVAAVEVKAAGPAEVYSTTKSIGKFAFWGGTIIAAVFGAVTAVVAVVKEWMMR